MSFPLIGNPEDRGRARRFLFDLLDTAKRRMEQARENKDAEAMDRADERIEMLIEMWLPLLGEKGQ